MMTESIKKTLLIDAGNSRLKWSSLEGDNLSLQVAIAYASSSPINCFGDLIQAVQNDHGIIVLVSVLGQDFIDQAREVASGYGLAFFSIESLQQVGQLKNAYYKAEQLGADRFVAMLAAFYQKREDEDKGDNYIVVDCGTAITIDAVKANGQHLGGLILPGKDLCVNSLVSGTQQLDLSAGKNNLALLANNTHQAIVSGSAYGAAGAIQSICLQIEEQFFAENQRQNITKILCGGGAPELMSMLSSDFYYQADLIMQGLKIIAQNHLHLWGKDN
jgi:type III pantothenate kinase